MKKCFKIERELLFKNNIKEITSISLDSDYKVSGNELVGNFIINGDYKIHEVSINKEKFNFKIPFSVELDSEVDVDSVKLEINDFVYDYKKDELLVNIDYEITGDSKEIIVFEDKELLDEFLKTREIDIIEDIKEEKILKKTKVESVKEECVDKKEEVLLDKDRNLEPEEVIKPDDVLDKLDNKKDKFITYQIYKIKENDTLESIVLKYKTSLDELKEYNDLTNINIYDKIIIPYYE